MQSDGEEQKKEKKKKRKEEEATKDKGMTSDCVGNLLSQLSVAPLCCLLLFFFFFFFHTNSFVQDLEKNLKCMPVESLILAGMGRNNKEPWEPQEPFMVLRTVQLNHGLYESMLFWHEEVLKVKEPLGPFGYTPL